LIQGEVAANVKMQCGTCLKDISMDLQSIVCTYLLPLEEYKKEIEKEELTPEDLDREYYEGETVTLDDLVGDALMLELPMNPKCGLDCPGLSVFSETPKVSSLTLDPRLAPLLEIRLNKEN